MGDIRKSFRTFKAFSNEVLKRILLDHWTDRVKGEGSRESIEDRKELRKLILYLLGSITYPILRRSIKVLIETFKLKVVSI